MRLEIIIDEIDNGWTIAIEDVTNCKDKGRTFYYPVFGEVIAKILDLLKDIEKQLEE